MKTSKLVRRVKQLLRADQYAQIKKYASLQEVLKKLEKKEAVLREKLEKEDGKARRREILRKLKVVEAQRKKGLALKKELKPLRRGQ